MNTDVIPPVGGFLLVRITSSGYIRHGRANYDFQGQIVHRETRGLHELPACFPSLSAAKAHLNGDDEIAILELTSEGGGAALWMREDTVGELTARRDRFHSCYGQWPVRIFTI